MKTYKEIIDLIYEEYLKQKRENCEGCIHNSSSQIRHLVCLYDYNSEYYMNTAIQIVRFIIREEDKNLFDTIVKEITNV